MSSTLNNDDKAHVDGQNRSQFRLKTLVVFAFLCPPLMAFAYNYWSADIYRGVDYNTFVGVGVLNPSRADHVAKLLENEGIPNIIEGSVVYGVSVQPKHTARALALIQEDAASKGYWFEP